MIGLGGAEFRLPLLAGFFRLKTLEAIILNKATSLVVVSTALLARGVSIPVQALWPHVDVVLNLLAGSLVGAWWAAGHAMSMPRKRLDRVVLLILIGLGVLMLAEGWTGIGSSGMPMISDQVLRVTNFSESIVMFMIKYANEMQTNYRWSQARSKCAPGDAATSRQGCP